MWNFKKLLAVIDPTREEQKALSRACHLARQNGSRVTAFLSIYDFSYEMTTMLSQQERDMMRNAVIDDRQDWLQELIAPFRDSCPIDVKVVWHNRPYESILREVIDNDYDTIVKGTHKHDALKSVIFTPTDWHLMRKSPVPVLLVKDHDWPANGKILAAINAGSEDPHHQQLNRKITEEAQHLASLLDAEVHLVNAYPGTRVNLAVEIPEFDPQTYSRNVRNYHLESLRQHAEAFGISEDRLHVDEGLPEDVIPRVARKLDAELVILGTVGRTGLSAALIGNTAEHVIDQLDCDVLALKPDDFKSPYQ